MWTGARDPKGYGWKWFNGKAWRVHRLAWVQANGPIPVGLHVLHLCDNPACYEVGHLTLGTHADNMADMKAKGRSANQKKTHCPNGHPYDKENTQMNKQGWRYCRACRRDWFRAARAKARA